MSLPVSSAAFISHESEDVADEQAGSFGKRNSLAAERVCSLIFQTQNRGGAANCDRHPIQFLISEHSSLTSPNVFS